MNRDGNLIFLAAFMLALFTLTARPNYGKSFLSHTAEFTEEQSASSSTFDRS